MKKGSFYTLLNDQKKISNDFMTKFLYLISKNLDNYDVNDLKSLFVNLSKTRYKKRKNANLLIVLVERIFFNIDQEKNLDKILKEKKKEKFIQYLEIIKVPTNKIENLKLKIHNTNKNDTN